MVGSLAVVPELRGGLPSWWRFSRGWSWGGAGGCDF